MSFLAGLLPAIGGLLPGIVSTVGKVVGKLGSGDFAGAAQEVGEALSGSTGKQIGDVVDKVAGAIKGGKSEQDYQIEKERAVEEANAESYAMGQEETERRYKNMISDYQKQIEELQKGRQNASDVLPMWRGRKQPRIAQGALRIDTESIPPRPPQDTVVDTEEYDYETIPRPRRRRMRRGRRY